MTLEMAKPDEQPWMNVLLYGPPKTGKTAAACSVEGGVLLVNLDLPNATRYVHSQKGDQLFEVKYKGFDTLIDVATEIADGDGPRPGRIIDTVVIDPIHELYRRLLEESSKRALRPSLPLRGDTSTHIERFCRMLCEAPVNVVLVCHEFPVKDESTGQFEKLAFAGTSNPTLGQKLMGMVDVIGYTGVMELEDGGKEYVAQLVPGNGRRGGDRFDVLGDWRKLDLADWFRTIKESNQTTTTDKTDKEQAA